MNPRGDELERALVSYAQRSVRLSALAMIGVTAFVVLPGWLLQWLGLTDALALPLLPGLGVLAGGLGFGGLMALLREAGLLTPRRVRATWFALVSVPGALAVVLAVFVPDQLAPVVVDLPPLIWASFIAMSVVLLSPTTSIAVGVWCATQYLLVHWAAQPVLDSLEGPELLVRELTSRGAAIRRAGYFVGLGVVAAVASKVFRDTVLDLLRHQQLQRQAEGERRALEAEQLQLETEHREARTLSEAKTRFLAQLSHELRTPLNAVLGHADQLVRHGNGDGQHAATILRNARHLADLVGDAMDTALIEEGQLSIHPRPFEVETLRAELFSAFRHTCSEKALRLEVRVGADVPDTVVGDPRRVRQVLLNLVSNAVKYTREGEVRVLFSDIDPLVVEVEDTGIGIAPDQLEHIFVPYVRMADGSAIANGTGLGLAITHQLVEAMGGRLSVESTVGVGTRMRVELPLHSEDGGSVEAEIGDAAAPTASTQSKTPLVLPDPETRERLRELADQGDMAEFLDVLEGLADDGAQAPAYERLSALARAFDDQAILSLLDPGRHDREP